MSSPIASTSSLLLLLNIQYHVTNSCTIDVCLFVSQHLITEIEVAVSRDKIMSSHSIGLRLRRESLILSLLVLAITSFSNCDTS